MAFMIPSSNQVSFFWMQQKTFGMQVTAPVFAASIYQYASGCDPGSRPDCRTSSPARFSLLFLRLLAIHSCGISSGISGEVRMSDNQAEQKNVLIIRAPLSEDGYASIYFSSSDGRPMNEREWWNLKQVVELASQFFVKQEERERAQSASAVAGGSLS